MSENQNDQAIVVSAHRGGAAEILLHAMGHGDTKKLSRLGFPWLEATAGIITAEGMFRPKFCDKAIKALFVIGAETGLHLQDARLDQNKHFSLDCVFGTKSCKADYVIRISPEILIANSPDMLECEKIRQRNLRRAANEISAFIMRHYQDKFAQIKCLGRDIEVARQESKARHRKEYLEAQSRRRSSLIETEHYAGLWNG